MDQKKLIIAVVLSFLTVFLFQKFFIPPQAPQAPLQVRANNVALQNEAVTSAAGSKASSYDSTGSKKPSTTSAEYATLENSYLRVIFSNIGGDIVSIYDKEYRFTIEDNVEKPFKSCTVYFDSIKPDMSQVKFNTIKIGYNKLQYVYKNSDGYTIKKTFTLTDASALHFSLQIENSATASRTISYSVIGPAFVNKVDDLKGRNFVEFVADVDGKVMRKARVRNGEETIPGIVSWAAIKNRYFAVILKPIKTADEIAIYQKGKKLTAAIKRKYVSIPASGSVSDEYLFYAGPLVDERLAVLGPNLKSIAHSGIFGGISAFLVKILRAINSVVHNYGVSIILLTIIINLVMLPLTRKSFQSMQKMQEVQPHMEKLRELHKDSPQKLNKEMMELYKQYKVNPFGGCLPMILQLPIFIAFYQGLMKSIELKNAHFLWIKDLSSPDALFHFKDALPLIGSNFNLLPLITVVIMFFQQRLTVAKSPMGSSSDAAKQQKFMAMFFPIFFGFILYNFPAGLVLYWLTNSLLMTAEQLLMKKSHKKVTP